MRPHVSHRFGELKWIIDVDMGLARAMSCLTKIHAGWGNGLVAIRS